ncbi:MAG: hypothetical protein ACREP7_15030 [Lysobacter sp.]
MTDLHTPPRPVAPQYREQADRIDRGDLPTPARAVLVEFTADNQPRLVPFGLSSNHCRELISLLAEVQMCLATAVSTLNAKAGN